MHKNWHQQNIEYWQSGQPPMSPNLEEVTIFKELIGGKKPVCLLGMTKLLVDLCDFAVDLHPTEISKTTIQSNWWNLNISVGSVIGDGVINLEGLKLVDKFSTMCKQFICRVFLTKLPGMKYATHFPSEFPGNSQIIYTQENIAIVVWKF